MNDLKKYFTGNEGNVIHKWDHYFEIYERHFARFRGKNVTVVEVGVLHGGSLQMWKDYFGSGACIYGIDIDPRCKQLEEDRIKIHIGSQEDVSFLKRLKQEIPRIDILIDDGGHTMKQQIVTFEQMFPHIQDEGVYMCEDTHTSYWKQYGGGYKKKGTFVEYCKGFIDYIHAWHSQESGLRVNQYTETIHSLHFYDSVFVVEKRKIAKPFDSMTGRQAFP